MLGSLIGRLESEGDAAVALDGLGDLALLAAVQAMGERFDETPGAYVAGAARRFARLAGDQDWVDLMGALARAGDPARLALDRMVRWSLRRDAAADGPGERGCGCGAGGCGSPPDHVAA